MREYKGVKRAHRDCAFEFIRACHFDNRRLMRAEGQGSDFGDNFDLMKGNWGGMVIGLIMDLGVEMGWRAFSRIDFGLGERVVE